MEHGSFMCTTSTVSLCMHDTNANLIGSDENRAEETILDNLFHVLYEAGAKVLYRPFYLLLNLALY